MSGTYQAPEGGDPAAPAAGNRILYPKSDGWYDRDDATISRIGAVNNYAATTAPAVTDDSADGYSVGSKWVDTTADAAYVCVDATVGAAVWHKVSGGVIITSHQHSLVSASDGTPANALSADAAGALTTANEITVSTFLTLTTGATLTLDAAGAITVTASYHVVDTYGAAAADDLVTINGGATGRLLILKSYTGTRVVTVKDGAHLILAGDFVFTASPSHLTLIAIGSNWYELSRSIN